MDISDRSLNAVICWKCRRKNATNACKDYYLKHKKEHRKAQQKYYDNNKKKIMKVNLKYQQKQRDKKKKILDMDLPEEDGQSNHWMDWDNIPQCEGITLDMHDTRNTFGNGCKMRPSYRLVDKYDKTVRYLCCLHIKTIGSLKWYHIERLEHNTVVRKFTLFKWQKMQKGEKEKKLKTWEEKRKKRKKKPIGTYYNAHYPITNGNYQDQVLYPSNNKLDEE